MKNLFLLFIIIFLSGCSNGFSKYYQGENLIENKNEASNYEMTEDVKSAPLPNSPLELTILRAFADGYYAIGGSYWHGPKEEGRDEAISQAKKVGASLVLWSDEYTYTSQGVSAIPIYTPGTTSTTMYSGLFTGSLSGIYYGSSTTYNPGSFSTTYVPYSENIYEYRALFFAKLKKDDSKLYIIPIEVPNIIKSKIGMNKGIFVASVMKGSVPYRADILVGDVILSINSQDIDINSKLYTIITSGENTFKIWRDGKIFEKKVYFK